MIHTPPTVDVSIVPIAQARTALDFAQCLDQVRVLAGPLSRREIESRGGRLLRRTKIGQVLAGELPRRDFLTAYLDACGVAEEIRDVWFRTWARLVAQAQRAAVPGPPEPAPPAREVPARLLADSTDADRTAVVRVERVAEPSETTHLELGLLRAERDQALRRAEALADQNRALGVALEAQSAARKEADTRARTATRELHAALTRIAELTEILDRHRRQGPEERGFGSTGQELPGLRRRFVQPPTSGGASRLTVYSAREAEDLYGADDTVPPAVLGDGRDQTER